jgi:hypothetical protein
MGLMFRRRPPARLAVGAATAGVAYQAGTRRVGQNQSDHQVADACASRQDQPAPPQYVSPPPASTGGEVDELSRIVQMHDSGGLSDDEFTAAKAELLGT